MHHLRDALHRFINAVVGYDGCEEIGNLLVALAEHILMVEPDTFLIVELRAALRALGDVEDLHQFVEREDLLLGAGVPAQQREEVDDGLGEVAALAIAARHLTRLGVVPLQGEHGEAEAVAVALRQLALALGLEQQRKVGKTRHRVLPAKGAVKQHMQRRTRQPLLTADDVGDLHQVVIDDVG